MILIKCLETIGEIDIWWKAHKIQLSRVVNYVHKGFKNLFKKDKKDVQKPFQERQKRC